MGICRERRDNADIVAQMSATRQELLRGGRPPWNVNSWTVVMHLCTSVQAGRYGCSCYSQPNFGIISSILSPVRGPYLALPARETGPSHSNVSPKSQPQSFFLSIWRCKALLPGVIFRWSCF